ncbi:MAG: hypothetical protein CUN52_13355, partial [Phototrophicales bacterium]
MIKDQLAHPVASSTTIFRVDVWHKARHVQQLPDSHQQVITSRLYFLGGDLTEQDIHILCTQLLVDPVTEQYAINTPYHIPNMTHSLDV